MRLNFAHMHNTKLCAQPPPRRLLADRADLQNRICGFAGKTDIYKKSHEGLEMPKYRQRVYVAFFVFRNTEKWRRI